MTRKHSLDKFSDEEKQKLADMQEQFKAAQKEEPTNLREHLQAFNDGVIAIIITIIVLEITSVSISIVFIPICSKMLLVLASRSAVIAQ